MHDIDIYIYIYTLNISKYTFLYSVYCIYLCHVFFNVCTFSSSFFCTGSAKQSLGGYVRTRPYQSYVGFAQAISLSLARMMLRGSMPSSGRQVMAGPGQKFDHRDGYLGWTTIICFKLRLRQPFLQVHPEHKLIMRFPQFLQVSRSQFSQIIVVLLWSHVLNTCFWVSYAMESVDSRCEGNKWWTMWKDPAFASLRQTFSEDEAFDRAKSRQHQSSLRTSYQEVSEPCLHRSDSPKVCSVLRSEATRVSASAASSTLHWL